jgi:hypothetical protein
VTNPCPQPLAFPDHARPGTSSAGLLGAQAKGDTAVPSPAMRDLIDAFRDRRAARTGQAPPTLDELRVGFAPQVVSTRCLTCWWQR